MKKQTTTIAIASIFALTALIASAATHLNDRELGIGEYNEQASFNSPRLDERELGIGEYNEQHLSTAHVSTRESLVSVNTTNMLNEIASPI